MLAWNGKPLFDAGKFYKVRFIKYITVDPSLHGSVNLSRYSGEPGDVITAFAVPDQHYTFDSYDITGAELTGSRFTIGNDNIHIQGNFVPKVYSVSYYNDGHGTLAGSLTTATANMTGTLTATPNSHYLFGNYAVTGGSIIGDRLTVTGNCSAKVYFAAEPKYNITLTQQIGGSISADKTTAYSGDIVTLSNTPNNYYSFEKYNITGATLTGNSFEIGDSDVDVQGVFVADQYNVSYTNDGHGSLTGTLTTATGGMTTTLTATPNTHYNLNNITVTGGTVNGNVLTVTSNCTANASYVPKQYTVTYQTNGNGTLTGGVTTATGNSTTTLTATPNTHYSFSNYSVTGGTINGNTLTITANCTAKANFTMIQPYTLTLQQQTGGTIGANKNTGYDGDTVTLSNTASAGYTFTNYNLTGATLTSNKFNFNGSNVTARGAFNHNVYNITLSQKTGGTIGANKTTGYYGDTITLSNSPSAGYSFNNYSITGGTLTGNQFKLTGSNVTASPSFTHVVYTITLSQQTGGTISANKTTGYYNDTITLSNTANAGYTFNSYSITGGVLTGNQFKLTGSNVTVKPNYTHNVYNITLQPSTAGKLSANKTTGYYNDTITLSQTPSADYNFISYDVYGATLTGNQFKLTGSDVTVYANYSADYYKGKNVKIGNQIWATEDLNYLPDGMTLYDTWDEHQTTSASPVTAHCYAYSSNVPNLGTAIIVKYDVISGSREDYCTYSRNGAIYAASFIDNWRVPTSGDWNTLRTYVNTNTQTTNKAGYYLKSTADNGVDRYGFNITGTSNGSTMYVTTTTSTTSPMVFYVNKNYDWLQNQLWYDVNYYRVRLIKDV